VRGRSAAATAILTCIIVLVALGGAAAWALGALASRAREAAVTALSSALRRDVIIGRVAGDPWRGLVFEDVTLPALRDGDAPLLEARRVTIHLDLRAAMRDALARRGLAPSLVGNIAQVIVDQPVIRVTAEGSRWNLADFLPARPGGAAPAGFIGRVVILEGIVLMTDHVRIAPRTFEARFTDVHGTADFAASPRAALRASFVEERNGRRTPGRVTGAYLLDRRVLDIDLETSDTDAAAWGPYLITTPAFRATGGRVDARVHLLRTPTGARTTTDFSGRVVVRDGAAVFPGRPARVAGVEGEMRFSDRNLSTEGLRGLLNGSRLEVRGDVSFYGEAHMDLAVRSNAAHLTALGRLFFPGLISRLSGVVRGEVRVSGPASAPRLWGRIESGQGALDRQPFEQASAEIALYGGVFRLSGARGRMAGADVRGDGIWTLGAPQFFLSLNVDGADAAVVRRWTPGALPLFDGRVDGTLAVLGGHDGLRLAGRASVAGARVRGLALDTLEASFRSEPSGVRVDHARARQGSAWASGSGQVGTDGRLTLDVLAGAPDLAKVPLATGRWSITGPVGFQGLVAGTSQAPRLTGFAQLGPGRIGGMAFDSASGRIAVRQGAIELDGARLRSQFARYRASGAIGWGPEATLGLDLEVERAPAQTIGHLVGFSVPIGGRLDGSVRFEGSLTQPLASGALVLRDTVVFGQAIDEARAAFRWDGRRLSVAGGSARRAESVVHVAGTFDRRTGLALDFTGRGVGLHDLRLTGIGPTRIDGHVDLTGRITGMLAAPVVAVEAASRDLTINALRFDQATGLIRWQDRTVRFEPLALRTNGQRYEVAGGITLAPTPGVSLTWTVADGRLSTLLGFAGTRLGIPFDATINGTASLEGPLGNPTARLDLTLDAGRLGDHAVAGRTNLSLANGSVTIQDLEFLVGRGRIAATGRYDLRGTSQIEVSGADLDLDVMRPLLRLRRPLLGRMDFTVQLGGTLADPELGLDLEITRGGVEGATFDSLVAAGFYRDGMLQLVQGLLVQNGHKLRAAGSVPFNPKSLRFDEGAPLDFRLTLADVNLSLLKLVTDRVEEARGAVEGGLTLSGTVAAPQLSGTMRVADGVVRLQGVRTPVEALTLGVRFDENTIRITEGSARIGGGAARLDGTMRLTVSPSAGLLLEAGQDAPLVLQGAGLRIAAPPFADARFDGTVRAWGTLGDPRRPVTLDGRIAVSEGTLALSAATGSGDPGRRAIPVVFQGLEMDAGRDLVVRVGDLRFVLRPEGSLVLSGTPASPKLEGTVEAQRGAVMALGNTFDLLEGTATFRPALGVRPQVAARAVTRIGGTVVTLAVRGTAPDALVLDLQSDPPRPQSEILALLGQQAGISQLLTGDVTALLRAEISRRLFAPVTLAIGRALGLSELTIEYDFDRPLRLTAGKALLPNLYVTASTIFEERARWLWSLEYRFAPGWQFAFRLEPEGQRSAIVWYTTRF
jgi:translocation and assembly module TamB